MYMYTLVSLLGEKGVSGGRGVGPLSNIQWNKILKIILWMYSKCRVMGMCIGGGGVAS